MQSNTLPSKIRTRIVIGAGDSGVGGDYTSERLVLVVPDLKQAERLRDRHIEAENVKILVAGIGATDGTGTLHRFTLARVNSLRPPTSLTALMPGLRPVSEESVELLSVTTLLKRVGNPDGPIHLTINDPGNEQIILAGWEEVGILDRTESLELHAPRESLYTEAVGMNGLEEWLLARGFQVAERNAEDPDWPVVWFRQDVEGRALKQQLAELTAGRDAARAEADERRTAAEAEAAAAQKTLAELTAERDAAKKDADQKKSEAAKQREQANTWEKKALEFEHRLSRARDDLRRAEGQLEIVKDLLLRGERL